ncbi:MAG: hypothetical protein F6K19_19745 [Cyanothece sp. SIO1E1]|nr:hypothetical protein [Cyanothece sp. SIO1E1]
MNWQTKIKQISSGAASKYQILANDIPLTFRQVFEGWQTESSFGSFYNDLLAASPFPAFYWEHPPLTLQELEEDYEFVLVNSSALSLIHSDPVPFAEKFEEGRVAVRFSNLRADAELVAPTPQGEDLGAYAHLAQFVRKGKKEQQQFFGNWSAALPWN